MSRPPRYDLTFACIARNCSATIRNLFATMTGLDANGVTSAAVIGENGSTDGTRELIAAQARHSNVFPVDTSAVGGLANRLHRIAMAREIVKDAIAGAPWKSHYVCVADLDDVLGRPLMPAQICRALSLLEGNADLFGVSATSSPWYYDLLAYKSDTLNFEGLEAAFAKAQTDLLRYYEFHRRNIYPMQEHITRLGSHLCRSAFNGACIYHFGEYVGSSYLCGNKFTDCEHRSLNASLERDGRRGIYVSRDFSIRMPKRHGPNSFLGFYVVRAARYVRGWGTLRDGNAR